MPDPRFSKLWRDVLAHKVRTMLVVLSIAVGVFAILVVMGGRGMLVESFDANYPRSAPANATLYTSDFGDELLRVVERQPGVRAADGRRSVQLRYREGDLRATPEPPAGVAVAERARTIDLVASERWDDTQVERVFPDPGITWPPVEGEVVLERSAQQQVSLKEGDVITVDTGDGGLKALRVTGFAHDINAFPAMFADRERGFVSMEQMSVLGQAKAFNQLVVTMDRPDLTREEASRIAAQLRDDVLAPRGIQTYGMDVPEPGSHFLGDIFRAVALLLLALGVLALLLSAFLVVNSISALVAQQVRQVGVMKAIGGRSSQIMWMYMALVAVYGVLAVIVGLPIGSWWSGWFARFGGGLLNFGDQPTSPPGYAIALAIAVGLLVPLAAAFVPVRNGTRVSVVRALNPSSMKGFKFGHGIVDRLLGLMRGLPRPVALGVRNTFVRKGRLAMTLATLTLASAVVMSVMTVRTSILRTVDDIASWWNYDVEVSFQQPVNANALQARILETPGVTGVETWLVHGASLKRADGTENEALGVIGLPPTSTFITPRLVAGRWLQAGDEGSVVVNSDVANDEGLAVGSTRTFTVRGIEIEWRVVGIVQGQMMGPVVFTDSAYLGRTLGEEGSVGRAVVRTSEHTDAGQRMAADRLEAGLKDAGFAVSGVRNQVGMASTLASQLGILVTFLIIMAVILALVGVIGLSGTMIINVLESTREIGVMRAVGASHGSIFRVFVTEGVMIGLMSWVLGVLLTYPISLGLVRLLEKAITIPLAYEFSWTGVVAWLGVVSAISAVASLLPAYRASQVSVRDAIAYE
jgi:putative ABC transport system permease protein